MVSNIDSIVQQFPDHEDKIYSLFLTSESFRELCREHILCARKVLALKEEEYSDDFMIRGYEDLKSELEHEIQKILVLKPQKSGTRNN